MSKEKRGQQPTPENLIFDAKDYDHKDVEPGYKGPYVEDQSLDGPPLGNVKHDKEVYRGGDDK